MGNGAEIRESTGGTAEVGIFAFELSLARRLLYWAAASGVIGVVLVLLPDPFWRGFGIQALAWGLIDAVLAIFARRGAAAKVAQGDSPAEAQPVDAAKESVRLRRLLWINTGLDVLYVGAGLALAFTSGRTDAFLAGNGWGVVVQGAFLFGFDLWHARRVPSSRGAN